MFMFICRLNDPVWVWALSFLALAVSPETLTLHLCVHFFVWFCLVLAVSTYVCLCLHFFKSTLSNLNIH